MQRSWDSVTTAPLSLAEVISAEIIWAASKALLSASAILLVAALMAIVNGPPALLARPVLFLSGLTFGALALAITAIARSYDFVLFYTTLFTTPLLLLNGVFSRLFKCP